jgi:hypothetical protein
VIGGFNPKSKIQNKLEEVIGRFNPKSKIQNPKSA